MEFYINVWIRFVKIAEVRDELLMRGFMFLGIESYFNGLPIPEANLVQ